LLVRVHRARCSRESAAACDRHVAKQGILCARRRGGRRRPRIVRGFAPMQMRHWLLVALVVGCRTSPGNAPAATESLAGSDEAAPAVALEADFTQAERALEVLSAQEPPTDAQLDAVMATAGTKQILKQLNASRKVTAEQYRAVLAAAAAESAPAVAPADGGVHAARGVRYLREGVWPALNWGTAHVDVLAERLA